MTLTGSNAAKSANGRRTMPPQQWPLHPRLQAILDRLTEAKATSVGFPAAVDGDYQALLPFLQHLLNNVGDPDVDPIYPGHVKDLEREVTAFFADLFRAPPGWFGYVTGGGSEGNLHGLWTARRRYPDAIVYHSTAAHYSVAKAADLLGLDAVTVAATPCGEIDYDDLRRLTAWNRNRPAVVVASIGTTMTEAVDDVARIHTTLDAAGTRRRYVHADAALAGVPLALTRDRPGFDLADGADSITVSGHKFLGTPLVCGVVITRQAHHRSGAVPYTGSPDSTISGSRNGLGAVMLWHSIHHHGAQGLRERTRKARDLADYTCRRLTAIGWPNWRNPRALTVMLRQLPADLAQRWPLPSADGWSHVICMPGIERSHIDALIADLAAIGPHAGPTSDEPDERRRKPHRRTGPKGPRLQPQSHHGT